MTPTWSDISELLACGAAAEFEADLVVQPQTTPAPAVLSWVMDDPRANLHAGAGRSRITRAGDCRVRLDHPDGRRTLFHDGTVWQVALDETATVFRVRSVNASGFAALLVDQPSDAEEGLGFGFPSGPIREFTHQGRPVAVMAGDPGDGFGAVELSVDMRTGVLVRVAAVDGSWEAWLENLELRQADESVFRWAGRADPPEQIQPSGDWRPLQITDPITPTPDPDPAPADLRGRLLRVTLDELVIADGQLSPPRVGETIEVYLTFFEAPSPRGAESTEFHARAEPVGTGTPYEDYFGVLRWPTILRGDGWAATWSAPRPTVGHVVVTGSLAIIHDAAAAHWFTPTRAAVARIRVNRLTGPVPADPESGSIPGNAWADEPVCPSSFDSQMAHYEAEGSAPAIAVALDLDLDAAQPPRARNDFEPGGLSALGDQLWSGDRHRPILQRRHRALPTQTEEHLLPLPVSVYSSAITPHAGSDGLWIERAQTLWSVDTAPGGPAQLHDLGAVGWGSAVTVGPHLVTSGSPLRRFDTQGEIDPITLPPEITYVGKLDRVDEGLLVVGREPGEDTDENDDLSYRLGPVPKPQRFRLAVYDHSGQWTVGTSFGLPVPPTAVGRGPEGPWVLSADLLLRFDASLTRTTAHRLPYSAHSAGSTNTGPWLTLDGERIALHLRNAEAPDPWHLRALVRDIGPRGEFPWDLVLRLDNDLMPVATVLTDCPRPSIAVTADQTIWFSGNVLRGITADGQLIDSESEPPK